MFSPLKFVGCGLNQVMNLKTWSVSPGFSFFSTEKAQRELK